MRKSEKPLQSRGLEWHGQGGKTALETVKAEVKADVTRSRSKITAYRPCRLSRDVRDKFVTSPLAQILLRRLHRNFPVRGSVGEVGEMECD